MDRPTTRKDADARGSRPLPHEAFVLPSRRSALELCRGLLDHNSQPVATPGPILITGDAGVGKTWLCRRLEREAIARCRWVVVDLTPADTPADFYRLISHEIGLAQPSATGRIDLVDYLAERKTDGQRHILVIDEAQNLSMSVWEEVRILANRLDRPGGFFRMILVGQTALARRFSTRPFAAIEARLASRVHLGAIDADEAAELVSRSEPGHAWSAEEIETLHRDAGGNPRRILRKLGPIAVPSLAEVPVRESVTPSEGFLAEVESTANPVRPALVQAPLTGPARPPIRVDENMIEVGWSPEDSTGSDDSEPTVANASGSPTSVDGGEEAVLDHYAALQAWREWAENQARRTQPPALPQAMEFEEEIDGEIELEEEEDVLPVSKADLTRVRVEGEQKFAPFGQLFSRMAQAHDSE